MIVNKTKLRRWVWALVGALVLGSFGAWADDKYPDNGISDFDRDVQDLLREAKKTIEQGRVGAPKKDKDKKKDPSILSNHVGDIDDMGLAVPDRPKPWYESGAGFLKTGPIGKPFKTWWGAVWNPKFMVTGDINPSVFYSKVDGVENGAVRLNARVSCIAELNKTKKIIFGFRPARDEDGNTVEYGLAGENKRTFIDSGANAEIRELYMSDLLHETLPELAKNHDFYNLAYFVGLKDIGLQENTLVSGNAGVFGLSKDNINFDNVTRMHIAALVSKYGLHRGDGVEDDDSFLVATFADWDTPDATYFVDAVFVDGDIQSGDGLFLGASKVKEIGFWNTTARAVCSIPTNNETEATQFGALIFGEASITPSPSHKSQFYLNGYAGIDDYTPAVFEPGLRSGPLSNVGITHAPAAIGVPGLISNHQKVIGGVAGYHWIANKSETNQFIFEGGGQYNYGDDTNNAMAMAIQHRKRLAPKIQIRTTVGGALVGNQKPTTLATFDLEYEDPRPDDTIFETRQQRLESVKGRIAR